MKMNKKQFFNAIRHIKCMTENNMIELFGDNMGSHLHSKLYNTHDGDVGRWLCYLDLSNQDILYRYLSERDFESK